MLLRIPNSVAHFAVLACAFAFAAALQFSRVRHAHAANQIGLATRELSWAADKDVHRAGLRVLRKLSSILDSRAQGTARITDISLLPVGNTDP